MVDSQSNAIAEYARRNNVRFDVKPREKLILVKVPVSTVTGQQIKIFLPYDKDLKNAIITGMRSGVGESVANQVFPTTWADGVAMAILGNFKQFVINIKNEAREFLFAQHPMFQLLQSAVINQDAQLRCCFRFVPEDSYLEYFDLATTRSNFYFPIIFTYHPLIP